VVLFAVSLFFAGMSTKLRSERLRMVAVGMGCAVFLGTAIWMTTFPVSVAV
jgi:formate/nitrite transporter FocA (FNT family)